MKEYEISLSPRKNKRYLVFTPEGKEIHFSNSNYDNYLIHNDNKRKERYIARHKKREDWTKKGINTAGWWARYFSWNKKTPEKSIKDIQNKFNVKVILI